MTLEMRLKRFGWQTALSAGMVEARSWLEEAVLTEANPYVQHAVMGVAAGVVSKRLPQVVARLISEPFDHTEAGDGLNVPCEDGRRRGRANVRHLRGLARIAQLRLHQSRIRDDPTDAAGWGGAMQIGVADSAFALMQDFAKKVRLEIPGRKTVDIWLSSTGREDTIIFVGEHEYPEPLSGQREP